MVTTATLENKNVHLVHLVLPRLKYEHTSTAGTLCTFTYDVWRNLRVGVNTWELSDGRAIGGLLQDLGGDGQLSMRDLEITVTSPNEARDLQQVSLFRNLHTLVIQLRHSVFVRAARPRWPGLIHLRYLAITLARLEVFKIDCVEECDNCIPSNEAAI